MGKLVTFFKAAWLGQCIAATYFAVTRFYVWYFTAPRGALPFYWDLVASATGLGLILDWLIGIFVMGSE